MKIKSQMNLFMLRMILMSAISLVVISCTSSMVRVSNFDLKGTWLTHHTTPLGTQTRQLLLRADGSFKMIVSDAIIESWVAVGDWDSSNGTVTLRVRQHGKGEDNLVAATNGIMVEMLSVDKKNNHLRLCGDDGTTYSRDKSVP